jgi:hypothetical protein
MKNFITRLALVRAYKLARQYGASRQMAIRIVLRNFWRHVWKPVDWTAGDVALFLSFLFVCGACIAYALHMALAIQ